MVGADRFFMAEISWVSARAFDRLKISFSLRTPSITSRSCPTTYWVRSSLRIAWAKEDWIPSLLILAIRVASSGELASVSCWWTVLSIVRAFPLLRE